MEARTALALLNDRDNRPREAMEQINALLELYPYRADLYLARGGMEQDRKQYETALHDMNRALELNPKNPDAYLSRASLYMAMKKKKLAKQDCQKAIALGADQESALRIVME